MNLSAFNALDPRAAADAVRPALDVPRWIEAVVATRPYASVAVALETARTAAHPFTDEELDRALSHHPMIGERAAGDSAEAALSRGEQASLGSADATVEAELAQANLDYQRRFGHVFLIRAAGRSLPEILSEARRRTANTPEDERREVAEQLREIAVLRLEGMLS
ncbi:2-oxo-4-hydroxy-4-carboxy-5-ureidoimidazoline decarboxylase [Kocuria tytonicola]|uniref:2-oxo-4-hydroxy-4-carboxy-5-ureidoimidazoline decarboxylase n=1 Tax=Kocuria tytonicola TaxID=2055946 RepID=A0A3L9KZ14_9MICC|nr:2-oxo-4-hydroxy-4-carboxy-5-ureidoimidazoline decarboxylase [Kocuria tytonicola]RLY91650.1 2-oxo-4-hydroxy-4-carboxy-5-ureidoimidazoline decarboxylase [Kocuria tytonicola]